MHTDPDARLVQAAREGDREAFAVLIERHRSLMLRLCVRTLRNAAWAEDAAQEATLQAMLALDTLRDPQRFGAWLAGIGLNICRRWLRDRGQADWSWEDLWGGRLLNETIDPQPDPLDLAEAAELAARVRQAVAGLPPGQSAAVLLFFLAGLTQAETAATLGIPVGAVKTRIHKARIRLREDLQDLWRDYTMEDDTQSRRIPVQVTEIRRLPAKGDLPPRHFVLLKEIGGDRLLPIWIGRTEAEAMAWHLEKVQPPRPMTYDLAANLFLAAGGRLHEVRISMLDTQQTFYAVAVVEAADGWHEVDARPSDALNLALILDVRTVVDADLMMKAGVQQAASGGQKAQAPWYEEGSAGTAEIAQHMVSHWNDSPRTAPKESGSSSTP